MAIFSSISRWLAVFACLLLATGVSAQSLLPKTFAPGEFEALPAYALTYKDGQRTASPPPFAHLRTMAEWEEIQALVITWTGYQSVLREIVRYAKEETQVIIICNNPSQVTSYLAGYGIDMVNVTTLQAPYNSVWMRDYGANTVYGDGVDTLTLVDWIYNRPRPNDDQVPTALANYLNLPIYTTTQAPADLVHTGGNFMSDGMGTAFSSELILDENAAGNDFNVTPKTEPQIDLIMNQYMGINRYIKMETLPYDGIHHIDMHMKLLDEETLLMGEYPPGVSDGPQMEANLQYVLSNFTNGFGSPYRVVRVNMPPDANGDYPEDWGDYWTYTNSVFVNKTVLVPIYAEQHDTTALRIYRESLPGYRVVGIPCNSIIQASGAIHCITHSIGVNDPLYIAHERLTDTYDTQNPYIASAIIQHRSGIADATLYYTTDTLAGYTALTMTLVDAANDIWEAAIPAQAAGTVIYYYIAAEANNGKQQVRPITAPAGWWRFTVRQLVGTSEATDWSPTLSLFPNPASALTCISLDLPEALQGTLALYDAFGRKVSIIHQGEFPQGKSNYFFQAAELPTGIYTLTWETQRDVVVSKLMVR